ncbi:MAG: MBL fold metallo-hydrolase [Desulfobacteraceae bacterium IS3]|nr:MAG: MBL fold metallo-hydrolase [Desulfobacteraceae bacterium IS3]HAO21349.1 MBL fold metallo-hydrolase [Desulfobacteraceae bacterium]
MKPVEIAKGVYDVGVNDWNIRDFHGYSTHQGSSYNCFLIVDEKITLIDTVKKEFADQLIDNISQIVDPKKIDYVISNHTEMDHSGSLPRIMHKIGEDKPLYCSKMGAKNLVRHYYPNWNLKPVESGQTLSIGKRTLTFLETRMVHWPDSMFTYLNEDKILFASDGFGQHYAGQEKFDDVVGDAIMPHAKKYFANILLLYAPLITKLIDQVVKMGIEIKMICPDHGIIWRKDPAKIINAYAEWSKQENLQNKVVIVYDTMWHSTEMMAEAITSGVIDSGAIVKPMKLREWHRSDIMTDILDAKAVIIGSPTLNNGLYPTVADFLTYMKGLKPQNKIGGVFGSYGWSGESVKIIRKELEDLGFKMPEPELKVQYVPDKASLEKCVEFGKKIGQAVMG